MRRQDDLMAGCSRESTCQFVFAGRSASAEWSYDESPCRSHRRKARPLVGPRLPEFAGIAGDGYTRHDYESP